MRETRGLYPDNAADTARLAFSKKALLSQLAAFVSVLSDATKRKRVQLLGQRKPSKIGRKYEEVLDVQTQNHSKTQCLKFLKNVSFNIASEAKYVYTFIS